MKLRLLYFICLLPMLPASALEERTFHNRDHSKSFVAEAVGYNPEEQLVTARRSNGREIEFALSLLSKEDQSYIHENREFLTVAEATLVKVKKFEGELQRTSAEAVRTTVTPTGYRITIANGSRKELADVTAEYTIYYRKGSETGPGEVAEAAGTLELSAIDSRESATEATATVGLERVTRSRSGGG